jgi:hypothetical protein
MSLSEFECLRSGTPDRAALLAYYDGLGPVAVAGMIGLWRGGTWRTGTRFDGLLDRLSWYGKYFEGPDKVEALLFERPNTVLGWLNFAMISPFRLRAGRDLVRHPLGRARLRERAFRGKVSTAMVYDWLPITDHFRKVDDGTLLGLMDLFGRSDCELFFWLRRAP